MLHYLRIRNLAVLETLELEFPAGFVAVTGETGAGKSVLLGALGLLAGNRADKTIIRQGADACEVEAVLRVGDDSRLPELLATLELPPCEEGALLLRRTVSLTKPPRVEVNGALTTVGKLQALGAGWIDFHGPHEPQRLFAEEHQLELLDLYARHEALLAQYGERYRAWRGLLAEREALTQAEHLTEDERAFLQAQLEGLDRAQLSVEGVAELERDFARLSGAQELMEQCQSLVHGLTSDQGVLRRLGQLLGEARQLGRLDAAALPLADRLDSVAIEVDDLAREFAALAEACDFNPATARQLEERMEQWLDLKRKYGSVESALRKREELARRLGRQGDVEGELYRLEMAAQAEEKQVRALAESLRVGRVEAARELARTVEPMLGALGFKRARFSIEVLREEALGPQGQSRCRFLFAANAGQETLPLNKIASSGELARVMLALKAILARVDRTPVLVFDEVDANIGGEIARSVARELAAIAEHHQVFCVTHLPQVAALASGHYVVTKEQTDTATHVSILALAGDREARLAELARMLGDRSSATARTHAQELMGAS